MKYIIAALVALAFIAWVAYYLFWCLKDDEPDEHSDNSVG